MTMLIFIFIQPNKSFHTRYIVSIQYSHYGRCYLSPGANCLSSIRRIFKIFQSTIQMTLKKHHATVSTVKKYLVQAHALTLANLKTRYRNTSLGFLWVLLNPILIYGAQSYAFGRILKLDVSHYNLFLVTGLIPWIFI